MKNKYLKKSDSEPSNFVLFHIKIKHELSQGKDKSIKSLNVSSVLQLLRCNLSIFKTFFRMFLTPKMYEFCAHFT